jgi:hypothetical protein
MINTSVNVVQTSAGSPTSTSSSNNQSTTIQLGTKNAASSTVTTTGWLTYSSPEYGIVLKYPAGWTVKATSTPSQGNIDFTKDGYDLSFQLCHPAQSCYQYEKDEQESSYNSQLAPPIGMSLIIGGNHAWRTVEPVGSWDSEYGDAPNFSIIFLRNATSTTDTMGFNDRTKYTPTSKSIELNDIYYTIDYSLPYPITKTDYDHSIINQMDEIVQNAVFIQQ